MKWSSSVTTQAAVSENHTTSVTVMMTVVTGLMNQPTAVSDSSVNCSPWLGPRTRDMTRVNKSWVMCQMSQQIRMGHTGHESVSVRQ